MMTKDEMEILESKRQRGLILQNLKVKHPEGVDFEVLRLALKYQGHTLTKRELASHLEYLQKGNYVSNTYHQKYILFTVIANKGINLIEKNCDDVGIFI